MSLPVLFFAGVADNYSKITRVSCAEGAPDGIREAREKVVSADGDRLTNAAHVMQFKDDFARRGLSDARRARTVSQFRSLSAIRRLGEAIP